ncbi:toll/interleukin-1 receptor domain-containing protein [Parvularcula flava]|uniref:Toll/interleukin-1 receptor domain-containing protein n=1 Tax=Aquisalinus luteolus TaxID=1566827 RepID=A0A8J3A3W8_9PROT|nr:toll/interleukin-1 receptor domain-containing protein [Aquisalinus luteolus]NHK29095.1 toll/interleukin-1 receptor domain-containing protein [Aquisalinus luteolus]GGI00325.1 hypothetical protein GCM10011355_28350 [Aquisalinus luteolus]
MKVFISWSGARSKALANALRDWLPLVLQYVEPWVSDKDISAGDRWAQSIAGELESANFGIICVTPENLQSEWILFEAGALSKSMLDAKVIPLLFGLELSDLSGPLSQFQAQKVDQSGILEVVKSINKIAEEKTSADIVARLVPQLWPSLQTELAKIPNAQPTDKQVRSQHEILEELVTGVRGLNSRIRDFETAFVERGEPSRKKRKRLHPAIFDEFNEMSRDYDDAPIVLVLMAGYVREDFPWLAEILNESYREIRDGGHEATDRVLNRLRGSLKALTYGNLGREMIGNNKDAYMMVDELHFVLDMVLHRLHDRPNKRSQALENDSKN